MHFDDNNNVIENQSYDAILVGLSTGEDISYSMEELAGLAGAANINVLATMVQNAERVNAATFIGSGKLEELKDMCKNMEADLVIFNDELSGMQLRNIEDVVDVRVIDRTILILDIFADRASSADGKLQVELAQLQYRMPRLLGFGKSLSRLGGGIGTRGPGEKKLETDRRHIEHRMDEIKSELENLRKTREVQCSKREKSELPVVALVGYTNSGKSSLMNKLLSMEEREEKKVFEKDMLFATLDTAQRLITLEDNKSFILIDTVGFVDKLPHTLVKAFKATLEEVTKADLLLHIVDCSFSDPDFHIGVTRDVMKELNADTKEEVLVFNKIDKNPEFSGVGYPGSINISAKDGTNLDALFEIIKSKIFADIEEVEMLIPFSRGDVVSAINQITKPKITEYHEDGTYLKVDLNTAARGRFAEFILPKSK